LGRADVLAIPNPGPQYLFTKLPLLALEQTGFEPENFFLKKILGETYTSFYFKGYYPA
jgi:hypothetical protein